MTTLFDLSDYTETRGADATTTQTATSAPVRHKVRVRSHWSYYTPIRTRRVVGGAVVIDFRDVLNPESDPYNEKLAPCLTWHRWEYEMPQDWRVEEPIFVRCTRCVHRRLMTREDIAKELYSTVLVRVRDKRSQGMAWWEQRFRNDGRPSFKLITQMLQRRKSIETTAQKAFDEHRKTNQSKEVISE